MRILGLFAMMTTLCAGAAAQPGASSCGTDHEIPPAPGGWRLPAQRAPLALRGPCVENGSQIDIMIVYTADAETAAGGNAAMLTLASDAVAQLNTAFTASGIPTSANLVAVEPVTYTESGASSTDLYYLQNDGDGLIDEVHRLRDMHNADLVCMFLSSTDVCGRAYIAVRPGGTPREDLGFSIVTVGCATTAQYGFVHEVGHNLGVLHDIDNDACSVGAQPYAHAYVEPGQTFGTVVSTSAAPRELMFSTPSVDVGGISAGEAGVADATIAITLSLSEVANFRSLDCDGDGQCDADQIGTGAPDCNNNGVLDTCEVDMNRNGTPDDCDIALGTSLDIDGDTVPDELEQSVLYVDADAPGLNTGLSWTDAHNDLQDALSIARRSGGDVTQIWIANGTYTPASGTHRAVLFDLVGGVSLYGGFAGGETSLFERNIDANETVLSGDLLGDDGPGFTNRDDNSIRVAWAWYETGLINLDGLTFRGGRADDLVNCGNDYAGGGLFTLQSEVTIRDCVFTDNMATYGAGAAVETGTIAHVSDTDFVANRAVGTPSSASSAG